MSIGVLGALLYSFGMWLQVAKSDYSIKRSNWWIDFGKPALKILIWPIFIWE